MKEWLPYVMIIIFLSLLLWVAVNSPSIGRVKVVDMRRELQQFMITIRDCEYIAYWTYSYDQSLKLIHAADCGNRSGHVIVLSNGATTQFRK